MSDDAPREEERVPLTVERVRELLDRAAPGAQELHDSLRRVFTLPDNGLRLD